MGREVGSEERGLSELLDAEGSVDSLPSKTAELHSLITRLLWKTADLRWVLRRSAKFHWWISWPRKTTELSWLMCWLVRKTAKWHWLIRCLLWKPVELHEWIHCLLRKTAKYHWLIHWPRITAKWHWLIH
jgi:hypothetical protein